MEESLNKFMAESAKRHDEHYSLIKEIRASIDAAIRNQGASIKALEIQIGQMSKILQERGSGKKGYNEMEALIRLKKLQINLTKSAKNLRRLLKENSRIKEEIKASMHEHCSTNLKDNLPPKEKDLGSFTLPCRINDMCFDKALADLGASVSVMPYSTFTNLGLGKLAPTKLIIELADKTVKHLKGIAKNVLVGIDKFSFLVDFIVFYTLEDIKIPLILGRPFLPTAHAKIDVFKRKFALRIRNDKIVFKSDSPTSNIIKKVYVIQDPDFGDFLELNDLNEPLELRNHKIEDLVPTIKEGEVIEEPLVDVVKIRHHNGMVEKIDEYPSFCDYDRKIFMENMNAYRDKYMGDVIFGKPFCRDACVEARRIRYGVSNTEVLNRIDEGGGMNIF
ncbi:lysophospholipid acyltransferase 1-like protein [Tanacetum coccineum]